MLAKGAHGSLGVFIGFAMIPFANALMSCVMLNGNIFTRTNSYIGIITPRGLETLVVETEHATPFLLRRAERRADDGALCCWAVLDDSTARCLMQQVHGRQFQDALHQLNAQALHLGALLPQLTEDHLVLVTP